MHWADIVMEHYMANFNKRQSWNERNIRSRRRGFWMGTNVGAVHVNGDPAMDEKTRQALADMMELAVKQFGGEGDPPDEPEGAPV